MSEELTPALKQFLNIKKQYPNSVLLFRMGDFYECFFEDAKTVSETLNITLTKRGTKAKVPLAGIPHHSLNHYLKKLIIAGKTVTIIEQMEDPKLAKGRVVKREVVRTVTPGTIIEDDFLDSKTNNYLLSLFKDEKIGIAFLDISTGEFQVFNATNESVITDLLMINPAEILIPDSFDTNLRDIISRTLQATINEQPFIYYAKDFGEEKIKDTFNIISLKSFGLDNQIEIVGAVGALLQYIEHTQKSKLKNVKKIRFFDKEKYVALDSHTIKNLELLQNSDGNQKNTLLSVLDFTKTPMGSRLLKKNIILPLKTLEEINSRLNIVERITKSNLSFNISGFLSNIWDLERLGSKIMYGNASPRDLISLEQSINSTLPLSDFLHSCNLEELFFDVPKDLLSFTKLISEAIIDDPPVNYRDGNFLRKGFNKELDELLEIKTNLKDVLLKIEIKEKENTGIKTLRIGYNKIFGFFFELPKSQAKELPPYFVRRQTLVNTERLITEELKNLENSVLGSEEKSRNLEIELFSHILEEAKEHIEEIYELANKIAQIDFYASLSVVAAKNRYVKPILNKKGEIFIKNGRHPVIEKIDFEKFIPNDLYMDNNETTLIITGPNMSGKCLVGESIIFSEMGLIPIEQFKPVKIKPGQFCPFKLIVNGINENKETTHFYYDGKKPTIKLVTKFGYTIEGTHNHPILVRDKEGAEIWRKLGEIKNTDYIIIKRKINLWGKTTKISAQIIKDASKYTYGGRVINYKLPTSLNKDLAYIIGLLIGDGTLTYKNYIYLSNIDKQIITSFNKIIVKYFGCIVKTKKNGVDHYIGSIKIRSFFKELGLDYVNALRKEIPYSILRAPKNIVREFLKGLFDTDGEADNKYGNASVSTSSLKLAKQVQTILLNFGIISSLKEKKTNRNKNYRITIFGENAIMFHKKIGFKLKRKKVRQNLASKLRMPNYGIPYMKNILKELQNRIVTKTNKLIAIKKVKNINSIFYTYLPTKRNISHKKLKELITYCELNNVNCEELKVIFNNNYFYDSIDIIKKSAKLKEVYDFSISSTHSFVANGLINHNSTFLRQNALIILLAHIGSFVPCDSADICVIDKLFTRIGASDNLALGLSTFMVEMVETSNILNNATENSFLILDEIGRGTSTYDGMSLAWAVLEHIHTKIHSKTLFATHYHQLNQLENQLGGIKNYHISAKEIDGNLVFLRKIEPGGIDKSYGICVAKLAGLPDSIIVRAKEIESSLDLNNNTANLYNSSLPKEESRNEKRTQQKENKLPQKTLFG